MRGEEPRGGTRGGKDQFNWTEVRDDKDRMLYLGNSLKAPVGRWQKGRDVFWFERDASKNNPDSKKPNLSEIQQIKMAEKDAMEEALGIKPPSANNVQLEQSEITKVLNRSSAKIEQDNIRGIGFDHNKMKASNTEFVSFDSDSRNKREYKKEEPYNLKDSTRNLDKKEHKRYKDEKYRDKLKHKKDRDSDIKKKHKRDKDYPERERKHKLDRK